MSDFYKNSMKLRLCTLLKHADIQYDTMFDCITVYIGVNAIEIRFKPHMYMGVSVHKRHTIFNLRNDYSKTHLELYSPTLERAIYNLFVNKIIPISTMKKLTQKMMENNKFYNPRQPFMFKVKNSKNYYADLLKEMK